MLTFNLYYIKSYSLSHGHNFTDFLVHFSRIKNAHEGEPNTSSQKKRKRERKRGLGNGQ